MDRKAGNITEIEFIQSVPDADAERRLSEIFNILLSDDLEAEIKRIELDGQITYNQNGAGDKI